MFPTFPQGPRPQSQASAQHQSRGARGVHGFSWTLVRTPRRLPGLLVPGPGAGTAPAEGLGDCKWEGLTCPWEGPQEREGPPTPENTPGKEVGT